MDVRLLMCPPGEMAQSQARREWDRLVEILRCAGDVRIDVLENPYANDALVDASSAALVSGKLAILGSASDAASRRATTTYRSWFASRGFAVTTLAQTTFAGTSDALYDRRRPIVYVGCGRRSDRAAAVQIAETVGVRTVALSLADDAFPTLDSALCPLGTGHILVYLGAFSEASQRTLQRTIDPEALIEVTREEALALSCSAIEVGRTLVLHDASPRMRRRLADAGYRVFATDLSAFVAAGLGARRLALRLDDGPTMAIEAA